MSLNRLIGEYEKFIDYHRKIRERSRFFYSISQILLIVGAVANIIISVSVKELDKIRSSFSEEWINLQLSTEKPETIELIKHDLEKMQEIRKKLNL